MQAFCDSTSERSCGIRENSDRDNDGDDDRMVVEQDNQDEDSGVTEMVVDEEQNNEDGDVVEE